jgi:hypothetical protein
MNRKSALALIGAIAIAGLSSGAALAASSAGPAVTVKVKSFTKTLTDAVVHGEKGSITKGGAPSGACPGKSAAGALDAATHGKWNGKFFPSFNDMFVTSIDGLKPKGKDSWEFLVNGKLAPVGVCETKLHKGDLLLFKEIK